MQLTKVPKDANHAFGLVMGFPTGYDSAVRYPLIVFAAGIGANGSGSSTDLDKLINGEIPTNLQAGCDEYGILLVAPQTGSSYVLEEINYALKYAKENHSIDTSRVYLTGLSLGGGATWGEIERSVENAEQYAAVAPIATTWQGGSVDSIIQAKLPVWAFHNLNDTNGSTPAAATISQVDAINAKNPEVKAAMIIFNTTGHGGWDAAYNPNTIPVPSGSQGLVSPPYNLYEWFLMNTLENPVAAGDQPGTIPEPEPPGDSIIRSYRVDEYQSGECVATRLL